MAEQALHLVVFDEGALGMSLRSPDLPGLIYGRADANHFWAELNEVLEFADAPSLPRVVHLVRRYVTPEGWEYLVAAELDDAIREREQTIAKLLGALSYDEQRRSIFEDSPKLVTGEVLFVVVRMSDTIDDVTDALTDQESAVIVAPSPEPASIWSTVIARSDLVDDDSDRFNLVRHLSLDSSASIAELFEVLPLERSRVLAAA